MKSSMRRNSACSMWCRSWWMGCCSRFETRNKKRKTKKITQRAKSRKRREDGECRRARLDGPQSDSSGSAFLEKLILRLLRSFAPSASFVRFHGLESREMDIT